MALLNVHSMRVNRYLQTTIGRFAMLDSNGNRIVNVGHGFVDGEDSYCLSAVRKARKEYYCEGILRAVRSTDNISPGTGDALLCGESDDCTEKILKGDLHAVLIINDVEMYGTYWTSWRMCIPCALSQHIVEYRETVLKKGEKSD